MTAILRPVFLQLAAMALVAPLFVGSAGAQEFPTQPIQVIVPTPPGGGTDIAVRFLAEQVQPILGQSVVIVNRPGGGGTVGMTAVTEARPDGYTLGGLWNAPLTMTPHSLEVPYTLDDYTPIAMITAAPLVFCVKADFPADTGEEFVEHLRENPGRYTYGNDGVGGTVQLAAERAFRQLDVELRPIPFGGAGETLTNFLGDHVDIYGGSIAPILPHVEEGTSKCLLLTSADPVDTLPQAASLTELGIPEAGTVLWRGIIGPRDLPEDIRAKLEEAFVAAVESEAFQNFMEARGEAAVAAGSNDFGELLRAEFEAFGEIVRDLGLNN